MPDQDKNCAATEIGTQAPARTNEASTIPARKWWESACVAVLVLMAALAIMKWREKLPLLSFVQTRSLPVMLSDDSQAYLTMATDGPGQVESPYTKRVFYPWLAGVLARMTGQDVSLIFMVLSTLALLSVAFCLAEILRTTVGRPWLALLFLLTPFPLETFELGCLPDLFHMALAAAFFLLAIRNQWKAALVFLLLGFLTRENTLVLCLCTVGLAWLRGRKRVALATGGVLVAGWTVTSFFGQFGKPNLHHLPDLFYLAGKLPYYFFLNFFGLRIWSNVRADQGTPFVTWPVPSWLHSGADKSIGLAYPEWRYPVSTLLVWLTILGVGPLIVIYLWRRRGNMRGLPLAIKLALSYGAMSYLAGPLLGDWVDRLVGYGWPLFWIAMPYLFYRCGLTFRPWQAGLLAACYSLACWWPRLFGYGNNRSVNPWPCFGVLLFYLITARILWGTKPALVPDTPAHRLSPWFLWSVLD
jgi:hypothetical protein